jgi:hypothetical protein
MSPDKDQTLLDRWIASLKSNPVIAATILCSSAIGGFAVALGNINTIFSDFSDLKKPFVSCEYDGRLTSRYLDNLILNRASIYAKAQDYWDTGSTHDFKEGIYLVLSNQEEVLVDIGTEVRSPDYFRDIAPEQFYKDKVDRQANPKFTRTIMEGAGDPALLAEAANDRLRVVEELIVSTVKDSLTEDSTPERCIDEWNARWEAASSSSE